MPEVKVKEGEELNGLGKMLKETMDTNLQDPKIHKRINYTRVFVLHRTAGLLDQLRRHQSLFFQYLKYVFVV